MVSGVWRAVGLAGVALLTLTSCTLSADAPAIKPVESAIRLGGDSAAQPGASASASPSPTATAGDTSAPGSGEDGYESEDSSPTPSNVIYDHDAELSIEDQSGNGKTVVIDEFEVNIDHLWLVICTEGGQVLATLLTTTESKPVTVTLSRPITKDQELVAYLYLDDGDGRFEATQDSRVYEEPGELIEEDFDYDVD